MADIAKEIKKEELKVEKAFQKSGFNLWMVISAVLVVILIVVLVWPRGAGTTIPGNQAGEKVATFINENLVPDGGVAYKSFTDAGNLYLVNVTYQGKEIPVYVTKDGKYFIQGAVPMEFEIAPSNDTAVDDESTQPIDVPKTDKPKVEAFVFSYCPYGLQFEKALLPAYNLLKNKAEINLVFIGAMHGEYEEVESLRQLCIQKQYSKDMLWVYLNKFMGNTTIGDCNADMDCSKPLVESIMTSMGISVSKINTCMTTDAPLLYTADGKRAESLGISGSPTFVINGEQVNVARNPEAIKQAICNAFTTAPAECSQKLSSDAASAWFGDGITGSATASC